MKKWVVFLSILCLVSAGSVWLVRRNHHPALSPQIVARSHLSTGNLARLDRIMLKAQRGEPITIGFMGGSITHGQGASKPELDYANQVANWWIDNFPKSKITVVNAGINGTGSGYGCLRVQRDLLSAHPDFVLVEYGVNDRADLAHAETYEGVVRQIMADPDQPAVMELFTMHHDGTNAQEFQGEIGKRYQLPMISYRDAVWPEIAAGRLKWADMFVDVIHPNDRGHAAIAQCVNSFLQDCLDHLPADAGEIPPMPLPRYTDLFAKIQRIDAENLKPIVNDGWTFDAANHCWKSSTPGSVIEFSFTGQLVEMLYARVIPNAGTVQVSVDGGPTMLCDAWFDGTWEGYVQPDLVARGLSPRRHRIRIKLISMQNSLSHGHEFRILGLAVTP
jgi:lysophospholipase L1-like esterase